MEGGATALFAQFMFFFILAPNRGEMGCTAFFRAPVAIVKCPQFSSIFIDAFTAAQRGAMPWHVVVHTEEISTIATDGYHFLPEDKDASN